MKWAETTLGQLINLEYGQPLKAADRDDVGTFPVAGSNGTVGSHSKWLVKGPGIVVGRKGSAGCVNWFERDFWPIDTTFFVRPKTALNLKWAFYLLNHLDLQRLAIVTGVPGLNRNSVYPISVPWPTVPEQGRIVDLLEEADGLRRQRAEADALADRILPALFRKLFGDPATNPKGWPRKKFGELLERIDSGWSPVCENREAAADESGVLKLGAVTTNRYLENENKALPADLDFQPELEVRPGDLLFTRKNTRELVGACAYVTSTRPMLMMSDLVFRLRLRAAAAVHPVYLWALLTYPSKRPSIQLLAGGSAGSMPNISKGRLETLEIEKPPYQLQTCFADAFATFESLRKNTKVAGKNLESLFATMLHRAFTGRLTAKWREAHMNELLSEMDHQARLLNSQSGDRD